MSRQAIPVIFTAGTTEQFVEVMLVDDNILEGDEDFEGLLSLPVGSTGVVLGMDQATATIQDDDGKFISMPYPQAAPRFSMYNGG